MSEPRTAIVTCMDARLDAAGFLDLWPGAVHVIRNAGARVTDDVLRSLAASCAMGTERIVLVHHTDCEMAKHTDEQLREMLPDDAPDIELLTIADPAEALQRDLETIRNSNLIPPSVEISGHTYELSDA